MVLTTPLTLTPYARRYRRDLLRLIDDHYRIHIHLDWLTVDQWLDEPDALIWLVWDENVLAGALAAAPPDDTTTWIRLTAVHDDYNPGQVLSELWPPFREQLFGLGARQIGLLVQRPWLYAHLELFGMEPYDQIVTLQHCGGEWPTNHSLESSIRPAELRDLGSALMVDHAAFAAPWRMSPSSLREAIRQAFSFTLAFDRNAPVGYQISTRYANGGHLARLATVPDHQGQGVGGALLGDLLTRFARRGITCVSVNTQQSNQQSQRLYQRFGFGFSGPDIPVWTAWLRG